MDYRQLGGSGLVVPVLTLGTGTFGGGVNDRDDASRSRPFLAHVVACPATLRTIADGGKPSKDEKLDWCRRSDSNRHEE